MDNSSVYTSRATQRFMSEHQISRMLQPPHFPNLAPSDFCFFPTVKNMLKRIYSVDGTSYMNSCWKFCRQFRLINSSELLRLESIAFAKLPRAMMTTMGNKRLLSFDFRGSPVFASGVFAFPPCDISLIARFIWPLERSLDSKCPLSIYREPKKS
jgi:hypothetical protein